MTDEQAEVLGWFNELLRSVTADGGRKRAAGLKPSWKVDGSHEAAIFSHLNAWKHGVRTDPDSGAHPLVHAAWRCLAIAHQEATVPWDQVKRDLGITPDTPARFVTLSPVDLHAMTTKWNDFASDHAGDAPRKLPQWPDDLKLSPKRKRRKPRDKRRLA